RGGAPVAALRADLAAGPGGGDGGTPGALGHGTVTLRFETNRAPARLGVTARFDASGATIDPAARGMTITLAAGTSTDARTLAPGVMTANRARTMFKFHDPRAAGSGRIAKLSVQRRKGTSTWTTQLRVSDLDLGTTSPSVASASATLTFGTTVFTGDLTCT